MKPLKLRLNIGAIDHYIYNGRLFVALDNGSIVAYRLNDIFKKLEDKYSYDREIAGVLNMSFRRNLYWSSYPVKTFLELDEVQKGLKKVWRRITAINDLELDLSIVRCEEIVNQLPSDLLCMKVYGNKLFIGCINGLYVIDLYSNTIERKSKHKKFDAKTYSLNTGYSSVIVSLGNDGFGNFDPFVSNSIKDSRIIDNTSFETDWTPGGSLINYSDKNVFQFVSNSIKRNERGSGKDDRYFISEFAKSIKGSNEIVRDNNIKLLSESSLTFSGKNAQYLLDKNGNLWSSRLTVRSENLSRISYTEGIKNKLHKYGLAISGYEVADYPIIEFDEFVCLFQDNNNFELETEPIVSIHTYPSSSHFKDLISITTEDSINLHSIDVLSRPQDDLHPNLRRTIKHPVPDVNIIDIPIVKGNIPNLEAELDYPF